MQAERARLGTATGPAHGGSPLQRAAQPQEIAAVIAFLCSDDSSFVNGQTVNTCGGIEMD